ncbi:MAG TPA: hypothetical protein VGP25_16355 [Gemmatimonadaceae bacterium]|jgi:hypothetical protein|nr:hypothetical protein [Gemmatimonadaceae bacterium]
MTSESRSEPTLIEPLDLQAVAAALCCRFGEPSAEANRLSTLHELLDTSRALARALDEFTKVASAHYRGVHCTSDMRSDAQHLHSALSAWSDSVFAAGLTYRAWKDGERVALRNDRATDEAVVLSPYRGLADVSVAPVQAPPA